MEHIGSAGTGLRQQPPRFRSPGGLAIDAERQSFHSGQLNYRIRKVSSGGVINTVAGNGTYGFGGDGGPAVLGHSTIQWDALDSAGNVYIADSNNSRIRKITPGGAISTFAENLNTPRWSCSGPIIGQCVHHRLQRSNFQGDAGRRRARSLQAILSSVLTTTTTTIPDNRGPLAVGAGGEAFRRRYIQQPRPHSITPDGTMSLLAGTGHLASAGTAGLQTSPVLGSLRGLRWIRLAMSISRTRTTASARSRLAGSSQYASGHWGLPLRGGWWACDVCPV